MSTRFTPASPIEVPLPADYQQQQCLPLVIMQPTADATSYMLKENYATNGQPGVVDHAVIADTANSVDWYNITQTPLPFPPLPHAPTHLLNGTDPIPLATPQSDGMLPQGTGNGADYLGGDITYHSLPPQTRWRSELPVSIDPSMTNGAVLASGFVANAVPAIYELGEIYLFDCNPAYPPAAGTTVHVDIYDPAIPGWVQVTSSTDLSAMTALNYLLRPILLSSAMTRVFSAPAANGLQWRIVLDVSGARASYFKAGIALGSFAAQSL